MGQYTLSQYFRDQWNRLPIPIPVDDIRSKTILVTGSNTGLGFEASVHLASMRPKTLFATCRNQAKCEETRESIMKRAVANGVQDVHVQTLTLEMRTFRDVCAFVDQFAGDSNGVLHALVANAGMLQEHYSRTEDGWETMLQVNYLSTALLSILLLPYLINSSTPESPSRLVIVSSFSHYFLGLEGTESWNEILKTISSPEYDKSNARRYPTSKLLGIIFVRELSSRLPEPTPVIVCTVSPGHCHSSIHRRECTFVSGLMSVLNAVQLLRTVEHGSRTLVHAAVASDRSMHSHYLSCYKAAEEADFLFTPEGRAFSAKVWDETIAVLSSADGRVSEIIGKYLQANSL